VRGVGWGVHCDPGLVYHIVLGGDTGLDVLALHLQWVCCMLSYHMSGQVVLMGGMRTLSGSRVEVVTG
jgi:hypothetical protein